MRQKKKMHDVLFKNNILVDLICLFNEHHLSHLYLNWFFFLWGAIFTYWRPKKGKKKYFVIISLYRSKRQFRKKLSKNLKEKP
jgi:hypothetical protein